VADQSVLSGLARDDPDHYVRKLAARKLEDQGALIHVARTDAHSGVRAAAAARIKDQETLIWLAGNDPSGDVRAAILNHLEDQPTLLGIARLERSQAPIDRDKLARVARSLDDSTLRMLTPADVESLRSSFPANQLAVVALHASDPASRVAAIRVLRTKETLIRLCDSDNAPIASAARSRLGDLELAADQRRWKREEARRQAATGGRSGGFHAPSDSGTDDRSQSNEEADSTSRGLIRYVLLVVCHPTWQPTTAQMSEFVCDRLPEFGRQPNGTAKVGLLFDSIPMSSIDMAGRAVEAFGSKVSDESRFIYRTLHFGLKGGEAKILVIYDRV
jgi:hypothetical protein